MGITLTIFLYKWIILDLNSIYLKNVSINVPINQKQMLSHSK